VEIKENTPLKVVTRPAPVETTTSPGEEETWDVIGERTVTVSIVWEMISAEIPSNVTDVISEPVPICQPLIVTVKQEAFTTCEGVTEFRIPPG
jgi:hypothetical protein